MDDLLKQNATITEPVLFTTGAFIQPMRITDENGNEKWVWVVSEFVDDTFWDGDVHNPREYGETDNELLQG
jgi:hypothetical protein